MCLLAQFLYPHPTPLLFNTSQLDLDSPDLGRFPDFTKVGSGFYRTCHLHPKLEVPGLTCPGWESNPASVVGGWEASTLEKSHSNSLLIANQNIYI